MWAIALAPAIPTVVAALVLGWMGGDDDANGPAPAPTTRPALEIAGARRGADMPLGQFLLGDAEALDRHVKILGCEGTVFTVELRLENVSAPTLRWSLRERFGLRREWSVPAAFEPLHVVPLPGRTGERRVWVPFPSERNTWLASMALYASRDDVPHSPADTWEGRRPIETIPLPPEDAPGMCEPGA